MGCVFALLVHTILSNNLTPFNHNEQTSIGILQDRSYLVLVDYSINILHYTFTIVRFIAFGQQIFALNPLIWNQST